jgi:Uma2 family endonuclease
MSLQSQHSGLSIEAYSKLEKDTGTRYEYHDGEVVAMAGGSYDHTTISGNAFAEITIALREKKNPTDTRCIAANENRKIYIQAFNKFLYPDAVVVIGKPIRPSTGPGAVSNPALIVEVLSKSTEAYDRGDKFRYYRQLESFREYLLIHQDKVAAEVW